MKPKARETGDRNFGVHYVRKHRSAVRCADLGITGTGFPSDQSLGYFRSSAVRTDFFDSTRISSTQTLLIGITSAAAPATPVALSRTLARRCRGPTLISTLTLSALSLSAPTTLALALSFDLDLGSGDEP